MFRRGSLLGAMVATAALSAMASAAPVEIIVPNGDDPKPRKPTRHHPPTPIYQREAGHTALDQQALAAAARRRAWRGAKRQANAQAAAAGYYFVRGD